MTLIDYSFSEPEQQPSVSVKSSSIGYRIREVAPDGWRVTTARALTAALCFGLLAAGGMVWSLSDTSFPGDPSISKAMLSTALYIVAAALVANGAFARQSEEIQIDLKGRVLHIVASGPGGMKRARKTFRFEEITRIDLDGTNLLTELRSVLTRWDYGRICLSAHGNQRVNLFGGDMMELEPLLRRLRADTGVA